MKELVTMLTVLTALTVLMAVQAWADAIPDQFHTTPDLPPPPPQPNSVAEDNTASIGAVYTASDFESALHNGVRDIEIHTHLDLRTVYPFDEWVYRNGTRIRSVRVRIWLLSHPTNLIFSWNLHRAATQRALQRYFPSK